MSTKSKVIIALIAGLVVFAFGRYSAPEKVKIETKTVEVEKKVTDTAKDTEKKKHQVTTITETTKPDGTKTKVTKIADQEDTSSKTNISQTDTSNKSTDTLKEITRGSSKYTLSALAGTKFSFSQPFQPTYGGMLSKEILGPISVGAFGFSSGFGGVALGVSF